MDLGILNDRCKRRECVTCGAVFTPDRGENGLTAMQKHSDHLSTHGSTPAQWTEAYYRIRSTKDRKDV